MTQNKTYNKQIAEEAASWAVALDDGPLSPADQAEFMAWLRVSPVHVEECLTALAMFEGFALSDPARKIEVERLIAAASSNVVSIGADAIEAADGTAEHVSPPSSPPSLPSSSPRGRRGWVAGGVAAAAALLLVSAITFEAVRAPVVDGPEPLVVATELGEQRSITLDDGSIVYVNTQSEISALYTEDARTVELLYGEALFDVEHDPTRPFRVIAGDTVAEALGTTFNVRFIGEEAEVSVVEGTVAFSMRDATFEAVDRTESESVASADSSELGRVEEGRIILTAGHVAELDGPDPEPRLATRNIDSVTAWTTRRLVFDEANLSTIAAEFNRYNRERLLVSPDLADDELFSGTFAADDPDSFVAFLELTSDIQGRRQGQDILLTGAR